MKIDSVVLHGTDFRSIKEIQVSDCIEFEIPFEWLNTHGVGLCDYKIYFHDKYFTGQILKGISNFTVRVDRDTKSTPYFTVFISNTSKRKIDIIELPCCETDSSYYLTPRTQAIRVNYQAFIQNPDLKITIADSTHLVSLSKHNFKNLNDSNAAIWVNDSSVLPINSPVSELAEFQIIIQAGQPHVDMSSLKVKSPALAAVNSWADSSGKVFIFDVDNLRKNPTIIFNFQSKRFEIKLSERDFSETYFGRKYYYITSDSLKEQY